MKTYKTLEELYLTFLTHNDSYMERIPVGSEIIVIGGEMYYKDKCSIDYPSHYIKYLEEVQPNWRWELS
jgi:hypothetical protein